MTWHVVPSQRVERGLTECFSDSNGVGGTCFEDAMSSYSSLFLSISDQDTVEQKGTGARFSVSQTFSFYLNYFIYHIVIFWLGVCRRMVWSPKELPTLSRTWGSPRPQVLGSQHRFSS
jgi:hypothetical protein